LLQIDIRRLLFVLIVCVDLTVLLVLTTAVALLLSKGGLGEWYEYWAEAVIALYGLAGVLYILAVTVFGVLVIREEARPSVARKVLWILAGVFVGYFAIPVYLRKHRNAAKPTPTNPSASPARTSR
jgi:TctA family transporter